jgi:hypothetical protein
MKEFEDPAYVLDYRAHPKSGTLSCANLATLIRDKSGKSKELEVYVVPADAPTDKPIKATATSNPTSKMLNIVVTIGERQQSFTAKYDDVLYGMSKAHPDRNW